MKVGRPSDYSPELLAKAEEYLASCALTDEDRGQEEEDVDEVLETQAHGGALRRRKRTYLYVDIPTIGGMARYLGVARSTLYEWKAAYPDFSDVMEALGSEQEDRLIQGGLHGTYNSTIAKVLLTKHGYADRQEMTGADGEKLFTPDKDTSALVAGALKHFLYGNRGTTKPRRPKGA